MSAKEMFSRREVGLRPSKCLKSDVLRHCHVNITAGHLGIKSTEEESKDLLHVIFKVLLGEAKGVTARAIYGENEATHSENSWISSDVRTFGVLLNPTREMFGHFRKCSER